MIVNLAVIGIILCLAAFYAQGGATSMSIQRNRRRFIIAGCAVLILQSGLRHVSIGDDTFAYYEIYEGVKRAPWSQLLEGFVEYYSDGLGKDPGYPILQKLVQYVLPDYQHFLLLIALVFFLALGNFIYRNSTRFADAVFAFVLYSCLFYSFFSITGHRQTIATAAVLYSVELVKRRQLVPFLLLILLVSSIHKSCLVFVPFYFAANLRHTQLVVGAIIALFPILLANREALAKYLGEVGGYQTYGSYEGAGTYTFTVLLLLIGSIGFWRMRTTLRCNRQLRPFFVALGLAIFFTPLTWVNPSMMRVVQYYSVFMLVLIPGIIQSFRYTFKDLPRLLYGVAETLLVVLYMNSSWSTQYRFYWQ